VQLEGWFLLRYRVFDLFSVSNGSQPVFAECWGRPFRIYATKQFPGLEPSTELTKVIDFIAPPHCSRPLAVLTLFQLLHSHHVPVRAREVRRRRKKNTNDSDTDSDQDQPASP
jgi:hypothetical protein